MKRSVQRRCTVLALVVACLAGPAAAGPANLTEAFEAYAASSRPAGWSGVGLGSVTSSVSKPSTVVVSTTDTFGNPTKALTRRITGSSTCAVRSSIACQQPDSQMGAQHES